VIFTSFIYRPNSKKAKEDRMSLFVLAAILLSLLLIYVFIFQGLLALAFLASVGGGLVKLKIEEIKSKGVNRFGSLPFTFRFSPESIVIGSDEFKAEEIVDLKIDAEDFTGGPGGDILSSSIGTNNFIEFSHKGEKHTYQFLIRKRDDLQVIDNIFNGMSRAIASSKKSAEAKNIAR
jgi:hypothetical protein